MATTAKTSSSSSNVRNYNDGQEDIESIAKQISDHAEQIYQTWKKSGLSPTEILNCRTDNSTPFNNTLSPTKSSQVAELLSQAPDLSNNNLGKLVSSFVNEDKARIAAQKKQSSPTSSTGSISHVLQKFERSSSEPPSSSRPNHLIRQSSQPPSSSSPSSSSSLNNLSSTSPLSTSSNIGLSNKNVPDVLKDTIEKVLPKQKPQTPVKPDYLLNHVPSWPLKNRVVNNSVSTNNSSTNSNSSNNSSIQENSSQQKSDMVKKQNVNLVQRPPGSSSKNASDLMDEVTREEERLINALKTGTVLNNEPVLPEVITSHTLNNTTNERGTMNSQPDVSTTLGGPQENGGQPLKLFNGVPAKPNHTPMFNVQQFAKDATDKPFTLNKVATTRAVLRPQIREIEETKNFVAKNTPSPVRPFLSRGSVAERVLIFEKAPPEKLAQPKTTRSNSIAAPKPQKPQIVSKILYIY